jgi:hypothetical protein
MVIQAQKCNNFMKEDFVYEDQTVERPGNGIEA